MMVPIPVVGHGATSCYGDGMGSFRDVRSVSGSLPSEERDEDEELEDLVEDQEALRALVREAVHEELRPLGASIEAMTQWITAAGAAATRLREQRRWG